MEEVKLYMPNGSSVLVYRDKILYDVVKENKLEGNTPVVLGKIDKEYYELTSKVKKEGLFTPIDITEKIGLELYSLYS